MILQTGSPNPYRALIMLNDEPRAPPLLQTFLTTFNVTTAGNWCQWQDGVFIRGGPADSPWMSRSTCWRRG